MRRQEYVGTSAAVMEADSQLRPDAEVRTILIIDDVKSAQLSQRELERGGYRTATATRGEEALQRLERETLDLVIVNELLADMTAERFMQCLKERRIAVPLVVVANGGSAVQAVALMKRGARDYIIKGSDLPSRLPGVVTEVLRGVDAERKTATEQQALQERVEQLRLAMTAAWMGTWESNLVTNEVTYSDETLRLFGVTDRNTLRNSDDFIALIHPDDRSAVLRGVDLAVQSGGDYDVEFRIIWPDNSLRWIGARGRIHCDEQGQPLQMLGISQDITVKRQADEALREIVQGTAAVTGVDFFESLVRHLAAALQVRWAFVGELLEPETGKARIVASWDGDHTGPIFEYELRDTPCEETVRGDLVNYPREVRKAFPRDQLYVELGVESYLGVPLRDSADNVLGIVAVLDDKPMTLPPAAESILRIFAARAGAELERKQADEMARRRLAELSHVTRLGTIGEMMSELAHEINQPLYAIGNFAEACVSVLQTDAGAAHVQVLPWIRQISEQSRRVGQIVRRLGRYVRKSPPRRSHVDLNELIYDVVQFLEVDDRWKTVKLTLDLESPLPLVLADRIQIEQVLVNLLLNAVEAMSDLGPSGRIVTVCSSHVDDDWVTISVHDAGRGVPNDKNLDKLFEPFFTTKPEGMGMGLAISRSLIQEHGGRLWATPNPDRGLTLRFTLPLRRKEEKHAD